MRVAYGGQEALTFMDYIDTATGRTLHAEPGGVYDIIPAGRPVDEYPAPWFTPVEGEPAAGVGTRACVPEPAPSRLPSLSLSLRASTPELHQHNPGNSSAFALGRQKGGVCHLAGRTSTPAYSPGSALHAS